MPSTKFRSLILCLSVGAFHQAQAAPLFTDSTKDAAVLEEAALTSYSLIGQMFGAPAGNVLTISNGLFSATGFSFSLTGIYSGLPTSLAFIGTYNPVSQSGTFSSTGLVGATSDTGQGTWSWADVGPSEEDLTFFSSSVFGTRIIPPPPPPEFDLETITGLPKTFKKIGSFNGFDVIQDSGVFKQTYFGVDTGGTTQQLSRYLQPPPPPLIFYTATEAATLGNSYLVAFESYPSGVVTGTITTTPEPPSLLLLGTALTLLGYAATRPRASGCQP